MKFTIKLCMIFSMVTWIGINGHTNYVTSIACTCGTKQLVNDANILMESNKVSIANVHLHSYMNSHHRLIMCRTNSTHNKSHPLTQLKILDPN